MYTSHNNFVIIKLGDDIMDLKIINEYNQFIYRVSALIYNQDLTKILLFKAENRALGKSMGIIEVAAPTKAANTRRKMRLLRLSIFAVMHSTRKSIAKFTAR